MLNQIKVKNEGFYKLRPKMGIRFSTTSTIVLFLLTVSLVGASDAQVANTQPDLSQLQKQLSALQGQIATLQKKNANTVNQDSRVRSIGSQRVKRAPEPTNDISLQIRLYDLSDLFVVSPSYPAVMPDDLAFSDTVFNNATSRSVGGSGQGGRGFRGGGFGGGGQGGGGFGGGGGGVFRMEPLAPGRAYPTPIKQEAASLNMQSTQVSMDQMVNTIRETVQPEMWGSGRDEAKVQFLGNTLLITATEEMHSQITNLLNLFREHWGKRRTITIETYWIRAGATDTVDLLDEKSTKVGAGVVEQGKWKEFLQLAQTEKRFAYSATMTGHNNQTLHALSGKQVQLVTDAEPLEQTQAAMWFENLEDVEPFGNRNGEDDDMDYFNRSRKIVGFRPLRQSFHNGAAVQVTPLATRGGNFVILDLHAKVNELAKPEEDAEQRSIFVLGEKGDDNGKVEIKLDHVDYVSCRLNTTVRCPKGEVVLAGSMTYDPNSDQEHPNIYLFVKTSVHTITEDKSDWARDDTNGPAANTETVSEPAEKPVLPKEEPKEPAVTKTKSKATKKGGKK